jgi:hypothetical protein
MFTRARLPVLEPEAAPGKDSLSALTLATGRRDARRLVGTVGRPSATDRRVPWGMSPSAGTARPHPLTVSGPIKSVVAVTGRRRVQLNFGYAPHSDEIPCDVVAIRVEGHCQARDMG